MRPFVTWGVVAAPELSLRLTQWCFPVAGCVTYRGYYSLEAAERYAARLDAEGLDVQINGVPAYSTLGWLDDPLLSTFINYPDAEVARLVFHELSHQVVYAPGDSMFNESFASTVEQLGVERWLGKHGTPDQRLSYRQQRLRREKFLELLGRHRDVLAAVYAARTSDAEKRESKRRVFEALKEEYRQMRDGPWAGFTGYDRWFSRPLGNAHLGSVATYTTWVPVFRQLFAESGEDFGRFYVKVGELAALNQIERHAFLLRRSDKLIGDDLLDSAAGAEPIVSPLDARAPAGDGETAITLAAARKRAVQDLSARDQVLHLKERDCRGVGGSKSDDSARTVHWGYYPGVSIATRSTGRPGASRTGRCGSQYQLKPAQSQAQLVAQSSSGRSGMTRGRGRWSVSGSSSILPACRQTWMRRSTSL